MHELRRRLDDVAGGIGFSGVARLDRDGTVAIDAAYGLADRAHGIAMTTATQLGMASGSKTFTALVVLDLIEQGRLTLATAARSLLGADLPLIADDVTVEQLLSHRSGIGDYLDEEVLDSDDYPMPISVHRLETTADFLPILDGYPMKFRAGTGFAYCNGAYVVLALLAERVSGRSYHDLVREVVCRRAALTETAFLRSDALPGTAALGYVELGGEWRTNVFHLPVVGNGDGGMFTTSADMSRFWPALMAGQIVGPAMVATMTRSPFEPDGEACGLGIWLRERSRALTMRGGDAGVRFFSRHDPEAATTITVIGNAGISLEPLIDILVSAG